MDNKFSHGLNLEKSCTWLREDITHLLAVISYRVKLPFNSKLSFSDKITYVCSKNKIKTMFFIWVWKICLLWPHVPDKEVCSLGRKKSRENSGKSNQNLRCVRRYAKLDALTYFSKIKKRRTQKWPIKTEKKEKEKLWKGIWKLSSWSRWVASLCFYFLNNWILKAADES